MVTHYTLRLLYKFLCKDLFLISKYNYNCKGKVESSFQSYGTSTCFDNCIISKKTLFSFSSIVNA